MLATDNPKSATIRQANKELFERYIKHKGTPQGRRYFDQIHRLNMPLARKVAQRASRQCTEEYEDLEQLAMIGLQKAIERFSPSHGHAFSSFAVPYIRGEIGHFLRDHWAGLKNPRRWTELHQKVQRIWRKRQCKDTEESIAMALGCTPDKWRQIQQAMRRSPLLDIDEIHATEELATWQTPYAEHSPLLQEALFGNLERLESPYRDVLVEAFFGGLNTSAIAHRRKVSEFQVKVWVQVGLRQMADFRDLETLGG